MNLSKLTTLLTITGILFFLSTSDIKAQANGNDGGNLGMGVMLGEPSGISLKSWNNTRTAFDAGLAWSFAGANDAIHIHADYLVHSWLNDIDKGRLAFYYGLGGRIVLADDPVAGARVPLGLNYLIEDAPVGLFVEVVPVLNLTPNTDFDGNGALGIRYYF